MNAAFLALTGFFCFTLMDVSIKALLHQGYPLVQVTFFNCLFAVLALLVWVYPNFRRLVMKRPSIHLLRAVTVVIADLLAFYSFGEIALAEAYTLILTMPLFIVLFGFLLRLEVIGPGQLLATLVGFAGVVIVLAPGFGVLHVAMLAALTGAAVESMGFLLITRHRSQETTESFAVSGISLLVVLTGVITLFNYQPMSAQAMAISLGGGICYALATAFVVSAFHRGSAALVSSMQYSQLIWGMLLAWLIWSEEPALRAMLGGLIIVFTGLWLLRKRDSTGAGNQS